jgi:hypothetical protein
MNDSSSDESSAQFLGQVSLRWQEAVAIVQEVIETVGREGRSKFPTLAQVGLLADGGVAIRPGGVSGDRAVQAAATLLGALLDGVTAPDDLVRIVKEDSRDTPRHATLAELSKALAFYERPFRRSEIAAVSARIASVEADERARQELGRIEARTRQGSASGPRDERKRAPKEPKEKPTPPGKRVSPAAVAMVVLVVVAAVGVVFAWPRLPELMSKIKLPAMTADQATNGPVAAPATPETQEKAPSAAPVRKANGEARRSDAVATDGDVVLPAPRSGTSPIRAAALVPAAPPRAGLPAATPPRTPVSPSRGGDSTVRPATVPGASPATAESMTVIDDATVYTAANSDVRPPILVRPALPTAPPDEGAGMLDILVDERGLVEQVLLISPLNRYQERMIVAAAKAWKFKPAYRDGVPVRYRTWVRITL